MKICLRGNLHSVKSVRSAEQRAEQSIHADAFAEAGSLSGLNPCSLSTKRHRAAAGNHRAPKRRTSG